MGFDTRPYFASFYRSERAVDDLFVTRICGRRLNSIRHFFQVRVRLVRRVGGAINSRESACAERAVRAGSANRVVVATAAASTTGLRVRNLRFGGYSHVVVRTTDRDRVRFRFALRARYERNFWCRFAFFRSLRSHFANDGSDLRDFRFLFVTSARWGGQLRFVGDLLEGPFEDRFHVCVFRSSFVRFIGNCNSVCGFVDLPSGLNGANRCLAIVSFG